MKLSDCESKNWILKTFFTLKQKCTVIQNPIVTLKVICSLLIQKVLKFIQLILQSKIIFIIQFLLLQPYYFKCIMDAIFTSNEIITFSVFIKCYFWYESNWTCWIFFALSIQFLLWNLKISQFLLVILSPENQSHSRAGPHLLYVWRQSDTCVCICLLG